MKSLPVLDSKPAAFWPPRLVATLAVAGLLSGLLIVVVYELTLPLIRANNARALRQAVLEVLPGAERMQRLVWSEGEGLEPAGEEEESAPAVYGGYRSATEGEQQQSLVGYAIPSAGAGFQDTIRLIYGFDPDRRRIVGMRILESRETPGLGDKIFKDEAFAAQFLDLPVDPRLELDAITGATISSKAVREIISRGNEEWLERLPERASAPPFEGQPEGTETPTGGPVPGGKVGGAR